jgi:glycolate oxidase FAD binding subunit
LDAAAAAAFWDSLRDQTHPFFQTRPLWRAAVPPQIAPLGLGHTLIEWNGGQRWVANPQAGSGLREVVAGQGGHATLFRHVSRPADIPVFHPLNDSLMAISRRLKHALDPFGIFNPKRLFSEF